MGNHPKREDKSDRNGEFFTVYVTDSREKIEQPPGEFKDLFKEMADEVSKTRFSKRANSSNIPTSDNSAKLSLKRVEASANE